MTTFRIIDTETTGFEDTDKIVEIACIDWNHERGVIESIKQTFVNPGKKIPAIAMAVHHISDTMVADAPSWDEVQASYGGADYYVAHNSRFDMRFTGDFGRPWIDTYRCALVVWPDAPSHANQVLRYWLGLEAPPENAGHAHRALYDCYVTAQLFLKIVEHIGFEEIIDISSKPAQLRSFSFGKHKGESLSKVPTGYLQWLLGQDFDEDVKHTALTEIQRRRRL